MLDLLRPYLSRPDLYERTSAPLWDDPHIAAQMLQAHLDPTTDQASRKPAFMDRSARWIAGVLPSGAQLLDLGCGPGLYGQRFSALGLHVSGIDLSERSIDHARRHDPAGCYEVGNYLELGAVASVDAATLIWCDYGALTDDERRALVPRVHRALRPGGHFIVDVFTPDWLDSQAEETSWLWCEHGGFFAPEPYLHLTTTLHYEDHVGLDRHLVITDKDVRAYNVWNTAFPPAKLRAELMAGGFQTVDLFGDVAGAELTTSGPTLCAVATA